MSTHKVPLAAGNKTFGKSLNGFTITCVGSFGIYGSPSVSDIKLTSETLMWDCFAEFSSHLAAGTADTKLEFFVYFDSATSTYRKFKNVRPVGFTTNLGDSNSQLWGYTLQLFVETPVIYTTAPGA